MATRNWYSVGECNCMLNSTLIRRTWAQTQSHASHTHRCLCVCCSSMHGRNGTVHAVYIAFVYLSSFVSQHSATTKCIQMHFALHVYVGDCCWPRHTLYRCQQCAHDTFLSACVVVVVCIYCWLLFDCIAMRKNQWQNKQIIQFIWCARNK